MPDMLTVKDAESMLQVTENMSSVVLSMDGTSGIPAFNLPSGWNVGLKDKDPLELTEAELAYDGKTYSLTKEAALGIAHSIGLSPAYVSKTPGLLIQSHLNYWATHSPEVALKMLVNGNEVLAVTKESIKPFSNTELLDRVVTSMEERFDIDRSELEVDFKFHHDLHTTTVRVINPYAHETLMTSRYGETVTDTWCQGVQMRNSLTGKFPTTIQGYLYSDSDCGMVTQHAAARYNRKVMGQDESEVYQWATDSTDNVFKSMTHEYEILSTTAEESIKESVSAVMVDIFKTYKVPLKVRETVTKNLVEVEDYTYYGVINALTRTANTPELPEHFVTAILEIAGAVAANIHHTCGKCHRVFA